MMPSGVQARAQDELRTLIVQLDISDIFFYFAVEKERKIAVVQPEKQ